MSFRPMIGSSCQIYSVASILQRCFISASPGHKNGGCESQCREESGFSAGGVFVWGGRRRWFLDKLESSLKFRGGVQGGLGGFLQPTPRDALTDSGVLLCLRRYIPRLQVQFPQTAFFGFRALS